MEKMPNFTFIGKVTEEEKKVAEKESVKLVMDDIRLTMSDYEKKKIKEYEIPKTPEQEFLFRFADEELKKIQEACGVESYDIPLENSIILSREEYDNEFPKTSGKAIFEKQMAILRQDDENYTLTSTLFHELFHCKGKIVTQLFRENENSQEIQKNVLRKGVSVFSTSKQNEDDGAFHDHFFAVEEAITTKVEQAFSKKLLKLPQFSQLFERFHSVEGKTAIQKFTDITKFDSDEVKWFDIEKDIVKIFPYRLPRKVLDYVIQEIAAEKEMTEDEIFQKFVRSHFTGHLLELGRMVETVFGATSFRRLGDMDRYDDSSAIQTLEALQKMRLVQRKKSIQLS